jgi:two-component system, OmpR family, phosphate regulon sensor histidine kinase PhoR
VSPARKKPAPASGLLGPLGKALGLAAQGGAAAQRELALLLLREALAAVGVRDGSLLLGTPSDLRLAAVQGLASEAWAGDNGAVADAAVAECLARDRPSERRNAFGHGLALPLKGDGPALGVLLLAQEQPFSAAAREKAAQAAASLGQALGALAPLARRRQDEQRLKAIVNAGTAVQKDHELLAVLDRIVREAEALLDAEAGAVFLLQPDGSLHAPVATGPGGERLRDLRLGAGEGVVGWVAREGRSVLVDDARTDPRVARRVDQFTQHETRSLVAVPITLDGRILGVLEAVNRRSGGRFAAEDIPALQSLALLAGVAIENARVVEGLVERARRLDAAVARSSVEANESRKRLESVLFAMDDAVIAADDNGVATLLNRAAQFLSFGLTGRDALGLPLQDLLPSGAFAQALVDVRSAMMPLNIELELGPVEARRAYAVVLAPIKDLEGYLTGFVVVLRDITRFRELERMKTAFLNTVSHELRTPITSIRAFSELMLRQDAEPAKAREWSRVINEESERLNRLVDDLLDVSRMESGKKLSVVRKAVPLKPLFERALAMQAAVAATHPIRFSFNEDLTLAELDPDRIQQVVMNLLSNAVKYSPDGGAIDLRVDFAPPSGLRVEVQDRGLGMREQDRAHVFEKFYRVEGAHMSGIRGTGLGLSISKYLVEAHGGRIGVASEPGQGSTFWFELPLFAEKA